MDRWKRFIVRFVTSKKAPALKKGCPFPLESLGALFLHSATYREQYFQYGGSLDGVVELFKEMMERGWADKKPELLLEIPLGLFRCIQEKIRFYNESRYGRFCKTCHRLLGKIGLKDPIERSLAFLVNDEFRTISPYLKKQILELTRQHLAAEEKKVKEVLTKHEGTEPWKKETLEIIGTVVFRSIHALLGHVDIHLIDRVFFELSDKKEPKFEKWVVFQVSLHLPVLLEEKQKSWGISFPAVENTAPGSIAIPNNIAVETIPSGNMPIENLNQTNLVQNNIVSEKLTPETLQVNLEPVAEKKALPTE